MFWVVVGRESGSVACNRTARERAAGNIQAGLADRDTLQPAGREIRDHVGNAVRRNRRLCTKTQLPALRACMRDHGRDW